MRKLTLILIAGVAMNCLYGQTGSEVVAAELSFARYAIEHSTRKAFLQYLDSQGVVFNRGEIRNGLQEWQSSPEGTGKLLWHPVYAAMSSAGDLGFTTGPFEFRRTMKDTAISAGQYTTIWARNKAGEWKFLADMGIGYRQSLYNKQSVKQVSSFRSAPAEDSSVMTPELEFIEDYKAKGLAAFRNVMMPESWFNIDREHPKNTLPDIEQGLTRIPPDLVFTPVSGGIASSRDLAYVYGTVKYKERKENYLRIWAYTEQGWKLLVQVLKW